MKGDSAMRILDENNNAVDNADLEKGYLATETIIIAHHEAVKASPGKSHTEVVKEYPNGGKDVVTIWDEEPVEAKDAYDETEEIQRYHLYTDEELKQRELEKEEAEAKEKKLESLYSSSMSVEEIVEAKKDIDTTITNIQVALADIYEQMLGSLEGDNKA